MLMKIRDIYEEETVMIVKDYDPDQKWARNDNDEIVDLDEVEIYDFEKGEWK